MIFALMAKRYNPGDLNEEQVFDKLLRYCDYQERCRFDIYKKCHLLGVTEKEAQKNYIDKLEESGYLNEKRFVKAFVNGKFHIKKWGIKRIERELKIRKISEDLFKGLLDDLFDESYKTRFEEIANRKWESLKAKSIFEKKAKLFRFLYGRGYESTMISEFLKKY